VPIKSAIDSERIRVNRGREIRQWVDRPRAEVTVYTPS